MSQDRSGDLPEGVIDAVPAGGWESAEVADDETRERSGAEAAEAGLPSDADTATDSDAEGADAVQSAEVTQGIDPDMATDDDGSTS